MICYLTFDVEEWFMVENLRAVNPKEVWESRNSTVLKNTQKILQLLKEQQVKATFFVLGSVAEDNPQLVPEIIAGGHEVASHGYGHDLTFQLTDDELRDDLARTRDILSAQSGAPISGYRAPNFSVNDRVISLLKELGFAYDSSYNPFALNKRHGSINGELQPAGNGFYRTPQGIFEMPISTTPFLMENFPIGGGAYFRIMPLPIFKRLVKSRLKRSGHYNFYLHPWEFEPEQPRIKGISLNHAFRHYYGLQNTIKKFSRLIEYLKRLNCQFKTLKEGLPN
ncbi:MAG: DUF3473 domain-containing protein [Calditrichia bacterium]